MKRLGGVPGCLALGCETARLCEDSTLICSYRQPRCSPAGTVEGQAPLLLIMPEISWLAQPQAYLPSASWAENTAPDALAKLGYLKNRWFWRC